MGPIDLKRWPGIHEGRLVARAADLTVPPPTKFERLVDLHAAVLGLEVPPPPLAHADEVIE